MKQLSFLRERALPDLSANIKCGNSLIGPDYYELVQMSLLDEEEWYRVNVFDWDAEFKEAKDAHGFDAVIGNPPYVRQETLGQEFKEYAETRFDTYSGTADLYVYFFEQAHRLLKEDGRFGMICSNKFMRANYGQALRQFLSTKTTLAQIVDFGELKVFQKAATFPAIFLTRNKAAKKQQFIYAPIKSLSFSSLAEEVKSIGSELDNQAISGHNWTLAGSAEIGIIEKMKKVGLPLGAYVDGKIYRGVLTGFNEAFVIDRAKRAELIAQDPKSAEIIKPLVVGDDVRKYHINSKDRYLIFARRGIGMKQFPAIEKHLSVFKDRLVPKPKDWQGASWRGRKPGAYQWYEIQDTIDYYAEFDKPKIIYPDIAKESRFAWGEAGSISNDTTFIIPQYDLYLLAVLNSNISWLFLKRICSVLGDPDKGGRLRLKDFYLKQLPIKKIDFSNPDQKQAHDKITALTESIIELYARLGGTQTSHEKTVLQNQIDVVDRQINALVYELYGLTDAEIKVVEASTQ